MALIPTEQINPSTVDIDTLTTTDLLQRINDEDQKVALAVQQAIPQIAVVVDAVVKSFDKGGRLFYVGAGTSGRLGVLDASECPPTFSTAPERVQCIIAGGETALRNAVEGAEDDPEAGQKAIQEHNVNEKDVVIGISASGGALYVSGAIHYAREMGSFTAGVTCVATSPLAISSNQAIVTAVGPEVVTGSTRMKAGTAQKLVLNMITTGAMIQSGKTYGNLMVDVKPTNKKLVNRAQRLVSELTEVSVDEAKALLEQCNYEVKTAVVMQQLNFTVTEAREKLNAVGGKLKAALIQL